MDYNIHAATTLIVTAVGSALISGLFSFYGGECAISAANCDELAQLCDGGREISISDVQSLQQEAHKPSSLVCVKGIVLPREDRTPLKSMYNTDCVAIKSFNNVASYSGGSNNTFILEHSKVETIPWGLGPIVMASRSAASSYAWRKSDSNGGGVTSTSNNSTNNNNSNSRINTTCSNSPADARAPVPVPTGVAKHGDTLWVDDEQCKRSFMQHEVHSGERSSLRKRFAAVTSAQQGLTKMEQTVTRTWWGFFTLEPQRVLVQHILPTFVPCSVIGRLVYDSGLQEFSITAHNTIGLFIGADVSFAAAARAERLLADVLKKTAAICFMTSKVFLGASFVGVALLLVQSVRLMHGHNAANNAYGSDDNDDNQGIASTVNVNTKKDGGNLATFAATGDSQVTTGEQQQLTNEQTCVLCLDAQRTVVLLPCKHFCLCRECSANFAVKKCPVCCEVIKTKEILFVP